MKGIADEVEKQSDRMWGAIPACELIHSGRRGIG